MTIPGRGDLSPRRKHRNWRQRFAVAAVVLVVAGIAYGGYRMFGGGSSSPPKALPLCPSTTTPHPPVTAQARLVVLNATLKAGLAADVAHQLRQRQFQVGKVGNTAFRGKGVATVQYSADRLQAARLVAAQFAGATMTEVTGSRVLELDIGPRFRALVPIAQAQAADHAILATAASGARSATPSTTPSPTCAPPTP
ncbi:MAG: LytR C-terminal domain-containing protein [Mycobacteriales bacterium]